MSDATSDAARDSTPDTTPDTTSPITGLARAIGAVLRAPVLLVSVGLAQWLLSKAAAVPVRAAVATATLGHAPGARPPAHERPLALVLELFVDEPSVATTLTLSLVAVAATSAIVWTLMSGAVIARFAVADKIADRTRIGGLWFSSLPAVLVQTAWHFAMRAAALFAALSLSQSLPSFFGPVVIGVTFVLGTVALDLARAAVVLHGVHSFHPRVAARAFMVALRTPGLLVPAGILAALGLLISAATVMMALWALTDSTWLWAARAASVVTLVLGLSRIAFVARHPAVADLAPTPAAQPDAHD